VTGLPGLIGAHWLTLPLPSLLGPMIFNAILCLIGVKLKINNRLLIPVFIIIGWQLGSRFSPEIWSLLSRWLAAAGFLLVWIILSTLIGVVYLVRVAKYDKMTSLYASLPGALASIVSFLQETNANHRQVIVVQTVRVFIVVGILPIIFALFWQNPQILKIELNDSFTMAGWSQELVPWLLMIAISLVVVPLFYLLRIPTPHLLGSTLVSAIFHPKGWLTIPMPDILLLVALYVLGCIIGSRFTGSSWRELAHIGKHALMISLILIAISILGALLCAHWLGLNLPGMLLAFAPGGVHEMTIIAFAFDIDPIFVAFMHLIRLMAIILSLPLLAVLLRQNRSSR